eukprot:746999-Hanusia_phi.AAC.4
MLSQSAESPHQHSSRPPWDAFFNTAGKLFVNRVIEYLCTLLAVTSSCQGSSSSPPSLSSC